MTTEGWFTSTRTQPQGNCVECKFLPKSILVRDTKNRTGDVLQFSREAHRRFLAGIQKGEFGQS